MSDVKQGETLILMLIDLRLELSELYNNCH